MGGREAGPGYVATWLASQCDLLEQPCIVDPPSFATFKDCTLRQVARISLGGKRFRLKLSNRFNATPTVLGAVRIALTLPGGMTDTNSTLVTFPGGPRDLVLQPGEETWSEPILLAAGAGSELALSLHVHHAHVGTAHRFAFCDTHISQGDQTAAARRADGVACASSFFMAQIDVLCDGPARVVVAFGDSLTDGRGSTHGAHRRYPDQLSDRLRTMPHVMPTSVVNAGIAGNRWTRNVLGPAGRARFERDVLDISGITHAILLLGLNDIGAGYLYSLEFGDAAQCATAAEIIGAMRGAIAAARHRGVEVLLGTLPPCMGSRLYTDGRNAQAHDGEAMRHEINTWIRAQHDTLAVVDVDHALRDPGAPLRQQAMLNSGDALHPNDVGYAVLAEAVMAALAAHPT